jgi:hypothetical protein
MSTFLELAQNTARECGIAQGSTYPTTVTGQTGILNKIVNWVNDSWAELQMRPVEWRWMRVGFTLDTSAADDTYAFGDATDILTSATIARFTRWRVNDPDDPAKCYLTSEGVGVEYWMTYIPWNSFKTLYKIGTQNDGPPLHITIDPQNNIVVGPQPNDTYTISGDFERGIQDLTADGDIPDCPAQFHKVIMYEAMIKYGQDQSAPELITRGANYSNIVLRQLEADQGEQMTLPEPLA